MENRIEVPSFQKDDLISEIIRLKRQKDALILAHYYQIPEIQDLADYVGDSLGLSQQAEKTKSRMIVFAGVYFMAETAKILNPGKKVVMPDLDAGCSLADSCPSDQFQDFINHYPDHKVVTYINCSAEIKAMSDIVCTSSNAVKVINSFPEDQPLIFAPDKNLGKYIMTVTGRELVLWEGSCIVHEAFSIDKLLKLHRQHPKARIIAHPESETHILKTACYIGSTAGMLNYVKENPSDEFIVATEAGLLHQMSKEVPGTRLIPAPSFEDNSCACSECGFMKVNSLEKLFLCLVNEKPEVIVPDRIRKKAKIPIDRMLELSSLVKVK